MTDGDLYACPVEGCDYGPMPMRSVLGHYSGKAADTGHDGGWNSAKGMLQDTGPVARAKAPDEATGGDPRGGSPGGSGGSHPAEQTPEPQDRGGSSGEESLPCCGNTVKSADLPDRATNIRCGNCGSTVRYRP